MKTSTKKLIIFSCCLLLFAGLTGTAFSENARQASLQGSSGGTSAKTIDIVSDNRITGDVKATKNSTISVGDVDVANTNAKKIDITTANRAAGITAEKNSHVSMGKVNVSNVQAKRIKVNTRNIVTGSVTAKDNSSASLGTVNVH